MNQITANLILLFGATVLCSVFYWRIVHRVVVRQLIYRLFARRDALRRMAIDGEEGGQQFAYHDLESMICKTVSVVPSISLVSFLFFIFRKPCPDSSDSDRFRVEATDKLKRLLDKTIKDALFIMAINSPILFTVCLFAALMLWVGGRFNKVLVFSQAESFVEDLPNSAGGLQPAY